MCIDLLDYTPQRQRHLRAVGVCAVFVVGDDEGGPVFIGWSSDLRRRLTGTNLGLHYCLWTPGKPVAARIAWTARDSLPHVSGRDWAWRAVNVPRAAAAITVAARSLYPLTPCLTHTELLSRISAYGAGRLAD